MGRLAAVIAVGAFGFAPISLDTSSAGAKSRVEPPQCPPSKKPVVVTAGTAPDGGPLYVRACGRAHATLKVGGLTYRIKGGFCHLGKVTSLENGDVTWMLSVVTGLVPVGPAVWLQIEAGHRVRAGQKLTVFDSVIATPGAQYAAHGETILRPHLAGGSFTIVDHGHDLPARSCRIVASRRRLKFVRAHGLEQRLAIVERLRYLPVNVVEI